MKITLRELLDLTMSTETTKNLLRLHQHSRTEIEKYYKIIAKSEAGDIKISTYDDYLHKSRDVLLILERTLTFNEYTKLTTYKPYLDSIILETFKLLV